MLRPFVLTTFISALLVPLLFSEPATVEKEMPVPGVEALFSPYLSEVNEVAPMKALEPLAMLISTTDQQAAKLTWAGFAYLHAGWDLEAYRHFCQALRRDENCLMAHAGVVLALGSPFYHEHLPQRKAAVLRMLELIELKRGENFHFPEKERGFAVAVSYLFTEGRVAGGKVFTQLAKKYPKDIQIPLMAAVFKRDGYNSLGRPNPGEAQALAEIRNIYLKQPDHPLAAQYFLVMHLAAPVTAEQLKREVLPVARKLAGKADIATWKHWLGVFEYRCGNLKQADAAFRQAIISLRGWKEKNKIEDADADALWRSQLYQAMVSYELGELDEVKRIATEFKKLEVDPKRLWAQGTQLILWQGYSLGTRLHLTEMEEDLARAKRALPDKEILKPLKGRTAALLYYEFLTVYLDLVEAAKKDDFRAVAKFHEKLQLIEKSMGETQAVALKSGEADCCACLFRHARMLALLAGYEGDDSVVLKSLQIQQALLMRIMPERMLPPLFVRPLELRLAILLEKKGDLDQAQNVLLKALKLRPSSKAMWLALLRVSASNKDPETQKKAEQKLKTFVP